MKLVIAELDENDVVMKIDENVTVNDVILQIYQENYEYNHKTIINHTESIYKYGAIYWYVDTIQYGAIDIDFEFNYYIDNYIQGQIIKILTRDKLLEVLLNE